MVDIERKVAEELELLREKDAGFRRRLASLREEYGGGGRLAGELDELEGADRAFANRVAGYGWAGFVGEVRARLEAAFLEEAPGVSLGASLGGDGQRGLVFYWDLERGELGLRGRGGGKARRGRMFGNREVVLDLGEVFDVLIGGGQHTSSAYPIVFSHDAERNRRLIVAAIVLEVVWWVLQELVVGVGSVRLEVMGSGSGAVLCVLLADDEGVSAVQLGFGGERELERQLDAYVEVDAEANFRGFVKGRQAGVFERCDFAEPFGRTWSVRLDRASGRLEILGRERAVLTIKRALRFVDPVAAVREVREFSSEELADEAYLAAIQGQIEEGFRLVYREVRDGAGAVVLRWGEALGWEDVVGE